MNKLLVITGPTATGKTDLGLELAEKFNGEIISADSRQVYKKMDIGTGKDTRHFQWGIDLVEPDQQFNVSDYVEYTDKVIADIISRKKLPIIVGGTGMYIKEVLNPSETLNIPPNQELREKEYKLDELQLQLKKVDFARWQQMNESDRANPRRLIRAIEVAGKPTTKQGTKFDALIVGLTAPYVEIYKRIDARVDARIEAGIETERDELKELKLPETLGYKDETPQEWKFSEHAYARRQMSYLRNKVPNIHWFDITTENFKAEIVTLVSRWYSRKQ